MWALDWNCRTCWRCTYLSNLDPRVLSPSRSTLCLAYHPKHQNFCQAGGEIAEDLSPPAAGTQKTVHDYVNMPDLPAIHPLQKVHHPLLIEAANMIGFQFLKEHNGFPQKAKVIEKMEEPGKFLVAIGDGDRKEIMEYIEIMNFGEDQLSNEEDNQAWTL